MVIAAVLAAVFLYGCAGMGDRIAEYWLAGSWWKATQTDEISKRAKELEAAGEFNMAQDLWRLIEDIALDQTHAQREINRLEAIIAAAVKAHYQLGIEKMRAGKSIESRNHFLAALRLDSAFEPARQQLKAGFSPFPLMGYHTVPGDRPDTIAKKVFGRADNSFLVNWFNDLSGDAPIAPGTLLILPKLEKEPVSKPPQKKPVDHLEAARERLSSGDLEGALMVSRQLNQQSAEVQDLIHRIQLKQATIQIEDGHLAEAQQSLALVPDDFNGKDAIQDGLRAALRQHRLVLDLEEAQRRYGNSDFQGSLDLATAVLARAPENTDARRLANEARYRLALNYFDHRQFLESRAVLAHADDAHSPSLTLKKKVAKQLAALAQTHYRNGVKLFINEQLQAAIDEWEKALACDPQHEKARENIDNARRIIKKIETLP